MPQFVYQSAVLIFGPFSRLSEKSGIRDTNSFVAFVIERCDASKTSHSHPWMIMSFSDSWYAIHSNTAHSRHIKMQVWGTYPVTGDRPLRPSLGQSSQSISYFDVNYYIPIYFIAIRYIFLYLFVSYYIISLRVRDVQSILDQCLHFRRGFVER